MEQTTPSVISQVAALRTMPIKELWLMWDKFYAKRPTTTTRDYLSSRLAYKIQEQAFGGMTPDIKRRLMRLGESQSKIGNRINPLHEVLPGTVFVRDFGPNSYRVTVTSEGRFELDGKEFKSLSAVARHITGCQWSGPKFFGLVKH
jgi:hypothetical protein